ncbi:MAG: chromosome segregation protein SMC [Eggerthellaceae bacterium]|nr:chromosome segregation protein SMC [Eggerthellaceae bacterium]
MYLKSLVLKGFKSFADRSVLTLEPGITAVVGPNGSGKSNISDAVLWVLGERNAKNLRGQVMEDVIFAGSSKRRSVNVAEVTLVLDNSDGALPVDYDEVSITRRMYRNGESEYLINGTLARRMDILDILHDSGLGTGTHSIISQGHLDSILQSKPEDRRALIEEAAGVLKHKQRKAKSQRKLEQMDQHLARVNDVVAEVKRQLGPLERKAKRALAYKGVSAELADLTLKLAVDDLRTLQVQYEECNALERDLTSELEVNRERIDEAEKHAEMLQEQITQDSNDVMAVVRTSQHLGSCVQSLEANLALLNQSSTNAKSRSDESKARHLSLDARAEQQFRELSRIDEELASVKEAYEQATSVQDDASRAYEEQRALCQELQRRVSDVEAQRSVLASKLEQVDKQLASHRESLAAGSGKAATLEARIADLETSLEAIISQVEECTSRRDELIEQHGQCLSRAQAAQEAVEAAKKACEEARADHAAARESVQVLGAELAGIEELERTLASASGAAYSWVSGQDNETFGAPAPLSRLIHAPKELEPLIERLLADDITSLLVDDADRVRALGKALEERGDAGSVTLVLRDDAASPSKIAKGASSPSEAYLLIDRIDVDAKAKRAAEALLGDVVVCQSVDAALKMHEKATEPARFATVDGFVIFPSGKVYLGTPVKSKTDGALERGRRFNEVKDLLEKAHVAEADAAAFEGVQEQNLSAKQEESLAAEKMAAQVLGNLSAARTDVNAARERQAALERDLSDAREALAYAQEALKASKPRVDELSLSSEDLEKRLREVSLELERAHGASDPAREREQELADALVDARLEAATLAERLRHITQTRASLEGQYAESKRLSEGSLINAQRYDLASLYAAPIIASLSNVIQNARARHDSLEQSVSLAQESSVLLNEKQIEARSASRAAHDAFDETNARLSDVRVEKGRLELKVQGAVNSIVHDCATSIESALELEPLENREEVELAAARLRNRIAKMGTINPDAATEYEQLKERYDYLSSQLADLYAARTSLSKIDRVIEARMKDDFATTFVQVNENFQEIFAILFPGGQAHLSLADPDDMETTGVEVSAQPYGKRVMKMSLMSGGEKSLVALALMFAVYRIRSAPFYILDEVEAALDDTNLRRLISYLEELRETTQLVMITHQRRTMEMADVLFGVSMQSDGISKVISQRLDRALLYAE